MARRRARRCWTYRTGGGLVRGYGRAHARASRRGDAEAARGVGLRSSGELGRGVSRARGHRPKTRSYEQTGWARLFHEHDVCDGTGDRATERTHLCQRRGRDLFQHAGGACAAKHESHRARVCSSVHAGADSTEDERADRDGRATRENLLTGEAKKRRGDFLSTKDDRGRSTRERAYYDS